MITEIGEKIIDLRKKGISQKKIKIILGCSKSTISKWSACIASNEDIIMENTRIFKASRLAQSRRQREINLLSIQPGINNNRSFKVWRRKQAEAIRAFLLWVGGNSCQICNYNRCKENLCFHHIDPLIKCFQLNGSELYRRSVGMIIEEAKKCALVCVLHHGEIHNGLKYELKPVDFSGIEIPESFIGWYQQYLQPQKEGIKVA